MKIPYRDGNIEFRSDKAKRWARENLTHIRPHYITENMKGEIEVGYADKNGVPRKVVFPLGEVIVLRQQTLF